VSEKVSEPYVPPPSRSNGIEASDNGLAAENDTTRERIRRPGPWTAVPSHIARDRHYMSCSLPARHMHLIAWLYANRERVDGRLHMPDFRTVAAEAQLSEVEATSAAAELVTAGLWQGRLPGSGYELTGFLKWNLCASEIESRAEQSRQRAQRWRGDQKVSPAPLSKTEHTEHTEHTGTYAVRTPYEEVAKATNGAADAHVLETTQRLPRVSENELRRRRMVPRVEGEPPESWELPQELQI
jgi:hypothetical protein